MKHHGSTSDHLAARDAELFAAYRHFFLAMPSGTPQRELYRLAVEAPATRLWVSERYAADVISRLLRERKRRIIKEAAGLNATFPDERRERKRLAMQNHILPPGVKQVLPAGVKQEGTDGGLLAEMIPERRAMFAELLRRVCELLDRADCITLTEAVFRAIHLPATRFYIAPASVPKIIARHRARQRRINILHAPH